MMALSRVLVHALLIAASLLAAACLRNPQAVKASAIRSGDQLMAAKDYTRAATAYLRAVTVDPSDGALRLKLAKAHEQAMQWTQAANQAMRAADLLPGDFEARSYAARLIMGQSRFEDSLTIMTDLLRERPADVDLLVMWGTASARLIGPTWALFKLSTTGGLGPAYEEGCTSLRSRASAGQDNAAEYVLRRAVELAPTSFDTRIALVSFLWAARRADESAELLHTLADENPRNTMVNETAGHFYLARRQIALGEKYLTNAAASPAPFNRAPRLALVDHYLTSGRPADALAQLAEMAPDDDEGGVVSARRADAEIRLGRYDNAKAQLDAILARHPRHRRGLALKAQLLLRTAKTAEAVTTAREAVAVDHTSTEARLVLAESLSVAGNLGDAFKEYAEALRLNPTLLRVVPSLARLALETGRDRAALVHARQAVGMFPDDTDAKTVLVTAQLRLRDFAGAAATLTPLLQVRPRPVEVQVQLGLLEAGRGNDAAARTALDEALRMNPDSLDALAGLVSLELGRRQGAEARARIDRVMASRMNEAGVLKIASRVFRAERDLQGAETVLRRALGLEPADTETALLLADCVAARGRLDDAKVLLDQVLARQPSLAAAQLALGGVLERLGRFDEAQTHYERILAEDRGAGIAAGRLAMLAVSQRRNLDVVLSVLTDARRATPDDPDVSDALGWVLLHKGLNEPAVRNLEDAVRGNPKHAGYRYHLGVGYARVGLYEQARAALRQSLTLEIGLANRPEAEAALAALPR